MKRNLRLAGMLIACVVALGAGAALWGHQQADRLQDDVLAHRRHAEEAQRLLVTIGEADANFRAFLLYGQPAYATRVHRALN
jgi:CHASE3 domain sensor protein